MAVPGHSSEQVEAAVIVPLEEALTAAGGTWIRAVATPGRAEVRLGFPDEPAARAAFEPVRRALAAAAPKLPDGAATPEVAVLTARPPALLLLDPGDTRSAFEAFELGAHVRDRLAARPGVRSVAMCARGAPEVSVRIDAARLGAYGADAEKVLDALSAAPAGRRETMVSELSELVVARSGKAVVRLVDVAMVSLDVVPGGCAALGPDRRPLVVFEVDAAEPDVAALLAVAAELPAGASLVRFRADAEVAVPGGLDAAQVALGRIAGQGQEGRAIALVDGGGRWSVGHFPPEVMGPALRLLAEGSAPPPPVDRKALLARLRAAVPPESPDPAASLAGDPDRLTLRIDRDRAARLGLSPAAVELAARAATVGILLPGSGPRPPIRVRLGSGSPQQLDAIEIPAGKKTVPLSSLATLEIGGLPLLRADRRRVP